MELQYTTSNDGFVARADGYMCFIIPQVIGKFVEYKWTIQSGGGRSGNGGDALVTHCEGIASSSIDAEKRIIEKLENKLNINMG